MNLVKQRSETGVGILPPTEAQTLLALMHARAEVERLSELLGRDLTHWSKISE